MFAAVLLEPGTLHGELDMTRVQWEWGGGGRAIADGLNDAQLIFGAIWHDGRGRARLQKTQQA